MDGLCGLDSGGAVVLGRTPCRRLCRACLRAKTEPFTDATYNYSIPYHTACSPRATYHPCLLGFSNDFAASCTQGKGGRDIRFVHACAYPHAVPTPRQSLGA